MLKNTDLIGHTPTILLEKFAPKAQIFAKIEMFNVGGSVKDRIAKAMIEDAEKKEKLNPGGHIVEPTSGNTGIGLALISAIKGYELTLVMPESMSVERRKLMEFYGAKIVLTPKEQGMRGAIAKAEEIESKTGAFRPDQFSNQANAKVHFQTTGPEIYEAMEEKIDYFVAGVGTGGTIMGVGEFLRLKNPQVKLIAVEPSASPVLSGGKAGPHGIQGIGAGFISGILDVNFLDRIEKVTEAQAVKVSKELAQKEGIIVGISSGAALATAQKIAKEDPKARIGVLFPDTGERYLSTILFEK